MKFLDLFAGIGGFRLGLEQSGHTCIGHVEIDKFAYQSYQAIHRPSLEEYYHDDITTITDETWQSFRGKCDIITAGFPCQSFSVAGKQRGFEDVRGTMFFYLANATKQIKPRYFIFENVKNLLSHDKGRTFTTILRTIYEIGYDVQWSVLNSQDFGVPQRRERVYIVGHLRGACPPEIFSIGTKNERPNEKRIKVIASTRSEDATNSGQREMVYDADGLVGALIATDYKEPKKIALIQLIPGRQGGVVLINGESYQVRRLTPLECFRLQGFPDWAYERAREIEMSDTQLYKQAGNAVTVNVVRWIGERIGTNKS